MAASPSPLKSRRCLLLVAVGLLLGACGSRAVQTALENPTPDALVRPPGSCQAPACEIVEVTLADFKIVPSRIIVRAPRARFLLTNAGSLTHAFEIQTGGGGSRSQNIGPGQTGYFDVELSPGEYQARCPIAGHAVRGQRATVTVLEPS